MSRVPPGVLWAAFCTFLWSPARRCPRRRCFSRSRRSTDTNLNRRQRTLRKRCRSHLLHHHHSGHSSFSCSSPTTECGLSASTPFSPSRLAVAWIVVWMAIADCPYGPAFHSLHRDAVFCPGSGWLRSASLSRGCSLMLKASKGEYFKLPIIGDFAAKQAKQSRPDSKPVRALIAGLKSPLRYTGL